jgi:hypothetical protein
MKTLNHPDIQRPLLPVYEAKTMFPYLSTMVKNANSELINDMLTLSFKENYLFWYIGKSNYTSAVIAKEKRNSFLWIMDEEVQNSFFLRSADDLLDLKLIHMVRLFNKTLDAVLFGAIEL